MNSVRMFKDWKTGLLHFLIVFAVPVIPVIVYLATEGYGKAYFYVLVLTVAGSFLYEYLSRSYQGPGRLLKIEGIICSVILICLLVGDFFLLLLAFASTGNILTGECVKSVSRLLVWMLAAPGIVTAIEIVRAARHDLKAGQYQPATENIVKGAGNV